MHDPEYLVDAVLRECIRLLSRQQDAVQLLQQGVGLIQIHIQDAVVAAAHIKRHLFSFGFGVERGACPQAQQSRPYLIILDISAVSIKKLSFSEKKLGMDFWPSLV